MEKKCTLTVKSDGRTMLIDLENKGFDYLQLLGILFYKQMDIIKEASKEED